jgi:8-oxo-dGTP pyrophosphatase MutT (NUDIX family)
LNRSVLTEIRDRLAARTPQEVVRPEAAQAAVALIAVASGADLELLIIRRAERVGDPWSGQMALPGGRRETADSSLKETAIRETAEEVGVELGREATLGQLDDLHPTTKLLAPIVVRPFVFGLSKRPFVSANTEVDLHLWAPVRQLRDSERVVDVQVRGAAMSVPAFLVDPHVIWGMTHRIIKPFLDLVNTLA